MTDTGSDMSATQSPEESHGESHASMSGPKSRRKSHVDTSAEFTQVRKSRGAEEKVTRPLPRKVTFSALSLGRAERDTERGEINKTPTPPGAPEPVGDIAERALDDLATRQRHALDRLRRQRPAIRPKEQP